MAEKNAQDDILPLGKFKQLLGQAEAEPLGCAMAMTKDKEAMVFISKMMKPKGCSGELKKHKGLYEPVTLRFGTVGFDPADLKTVKFSLNKKEAGGSALAMTRLIKKAGYAACIFAEDPALDEGGADEQESEGGAPAAPAPPVDAAALKTRLTALVQRIGPVVVAHPDLKANLLGLAKDAQGKIAGTDPAAAVAACDALEQALGNAGEAQSTAAPAGDAAHQALTQSGKLWLDCRTSLHGKLDALKKAVLDAYADQPAVQGQIQQNIGQLDAALQGLDERLDKTLAAAANATDASERAKQVQQSKALIGEYLKNVAGNQRLADIDGNPFGVQTAMKETLTKTLSRLVALSKAA